MKERIDQNFDAFAETYREAHTQNIKYVSGADSFYFAEYKVKELLHFEKNREMTVLDLGCGDGATEVFFEKHFSLFSVTGIDVSERSIEEAQKKELKSAVFQTYNGHSVPFDSNSFDIVFVAGVLHHIAEAEQQGVINEVFRVLKNGGRLYLFEHNPMNPLTRYLVKTCEFDKGVKLLSANYCKSLLKKSGFQIMSQVYTIFFPRNRVFKPVIRIEKYLKKIPFGGQYYFRAAKG